MPRLSDLIEAKRDPLAAARVELLLAEAHLNGIIAALSAGTDEFSRNHRISRDTLTTAVVRAMDARHALDEARLNALGVHVLGTRSLCTNDCDDLIDATIARLERNHHGMDREAASANAPAHPADIARADETLVSQAHARDAALIERAA